MNSLTEIARLVNETKKQKALIQLDVDYQMWKTNLLPLIFNACLARANQGFTSDYSQIPRTLYNNIDYKIIIMNDIIEYFKAQNNTKIRIDEAYSDSLSPSSDWKRVIISWSEEKRG